MKKLKKYISKIHQEEFQDCNFTEFEEYLLDTLKFEKTDEEKADLQKRLISKISNKKSEYDKIIVKLDDPTKINTIGELFNLLIIKNRINQNELIKECNLEKPEFKNLINNKVDITSLNLRSLIKLFVFFKIKLEIGCILLEKSIKLFQMNPSTAGAMARYSYQEGLDYKNKSMNDGLNELLLKASGNKKFSHESIIPTKIPKDEFIELFKKEYLNANP